ncbi:ubiquitin-associated domain-containing protein 2-like [Tubulanus polymorphus]|uniref:ubiquitin-associated domain-containing protein 2-like n=1 Tax=Tubulanus polymorphus TaxID=672921 RepID=UPI003DA20B58
MFTPYSHSGFYNVPVSKCFLGTVVLTSFALSVPFNNYRHLFIYSYEGIFERLELWRILTSKIAFLDTKDLICGGLLIYYFRIFERRYGSCKFASYLLATCTVSTVLELSSLAVLYRFRDVINIDTLPSGPYGLLFPMFVPFFCDMPRVAMTHIWGIPVTGKSFMYILGLQITSTSTESILVGICGIVSGLLYRVNFLKIQHWLRVPMCLARVASKTIGKLLSSPAPSNPVPMGATLEIQRQQQMEHLEQQLTLQRAREYRNRGRVVHNNGIGLFGHQNEEQPSPPPPEHAVQLLVDMGFPRDSVLNALTMTHNDMNTAMNLLLQEAT